MARVLIKLEKNNRKNAQLHSTGQTLGFLASLAQKYKSIFGYTTTYKLSPVRQGQKRQHCGCAFNLIFKNLIKIPMEGVTDGTHASAIQPDIFSSTFVSVIFWNEGPATYHGLIFHAAASIRSQTNDGRHGKGKVSWFSASLICLIFYLSYLCVPSSDFTIWSSVCHLLLTLKVICRYKRKTERYTEQKHTQT